jgi:hypothetical protein
MRNEQSADVQSMVVILIWLLAAGVGIGLYGQGHFLLALLAIGSMPIAIMLSFALMRAGRALRGGSSRRTTTPPERRRAPSPPSTSASARNAPTRA